MKVTLFLCFIAATVAFSYAVPMEGDEEVYGLLDKVKLAPKYVKLIEHFGEKAWHFLECMGVNWAEHCVSQTVGCLAAKNILGCIEAIVCEGKDAVTCAHNLK